MASAVTALVDTTSSICNGSAVTAEPTTFAGIEPGGTALGVGLPLDGTGCGVVDDGTGSMEWS